MPIPKSVTKLKKQNGKIVVEYQDNFDQASYLIHELTRAALRDVGKFVKRTFNDSLYQRFKKRSGNSTKVTRVVVKANARTIYPRVEIGLPFATKKSKTYAYYAYYQEFGSKKVPKCGLLTHAVQDNIQTIVEIESKYLKYLEQEADSLESLVDEKEYEFEGEDE